MEPLVTQVKKQVLSFIYDRGEQGATESEVFSILYNFDRQHNIFSYGSDSTPESIVESFIFKGMIIRNTQEDLMECRYYPAPAAVMA